jgi:hypothetical protein
MSDLLKTYRDKADDLFDEISKFTCFTRGIEFQKQSLEKLNAFKLEIKEQLEKAVSKKDNDLANAFASFELVTEAMTSEFEMWISLKEENYDKAWDSLVDAQDSAALSMKAHIINGHLSVYIRRLTLLEKVLFPPQLFFSDRSLISQSKCSICEQSIEECQHLKGKFYMGKLCFEKIEKIEKIYAYDIVKDPANKKCRATTMTENNKTIDLMTYREK